MLHASHKDPHMCILRSKETFNKRTGCNSENGYGKLLGTFSMMRDPTCCTRNRGGMTNTCPATLYSIMPVVRIRLWSPRLRTQCYNDHHHANTMTVTQSLPTTAGARRKAMDMGPPSWVAVSFECPKRPCGMSWRKVDARTTGSANDKC